MQYVSFMLNVFGNGFEYETNILISRRFFKIAIKILNWKHASFLTSAIMLKSADILYRKDISKYVKEFMKLEREGQIPVFRIINLETVNRCNGKCAFCPANVRDEKRPLKKMEDSLFQTIVSQLDDMKWKGQIFLNVNNEPLIDLNIIDKARILRERLGKHVEISMITNGTLLTEEKLKELACYLDTICINNYSTCYALTDHNRKLYNFVTLNSSLFSTVDITFSRRYSKEILASRAGAAPNKSKKNINITTPCIYPFTDVTVFPDGQVGLCCNDCFEITSFGNLNDTSLLDIWQGEEYSRAREAIAKGREKYPFCKECDVSDSGFREKIIKKYRL